MCDNTGFQAIYFTRHNLSFPPHPCAPNKIVYDLRPSSLLTFAVNLFVFFFALIVCKFLVFASVFWCLTGNQPYNLRKEKSLEIHKWNLPILSIVIVADIDGAIASRFFGYHVCYVEVGRLTNWWWHPINSYAQCDKKSKFQPLQCAHSFDLEKMNKCARREISVRFICDAQPKSN